MSYCLNPACQQPKNLEESEFCLCCGSPLVLRQHFRALRKIGQGGFGRTFLAIDVDLPSKPYCVIKQFFPQGQGKAEVEKAVELFALEAVRLDDLGKYHAQIPRLLAYFEQDLRQYLVQEYIEGETLVQELERKGAFNEEQLRQLLNDLLPVLHFVHSNFVIHRDIKPDNIIRRTPPQSPLNKGFAGASLTPTVGGMGMGGQLVLVDFGAAKFATGTALATTQTKIGDFRYMAPEQAAGRSIFASDIYSLGVTCIHLLTGVPALNLFDDGEGTWVWKGYLKTPVSDSLVYILDKMLELGTKRRYASVNEVMQDLKCLSVSVNSGLEMSSQVSAATKIAIRNTFQENVSLRSYQDLTIILDKSESMSKLIEERGISRWEEAQTAIYTLSQEWEKVNSNEITLYLFWSLFKRYNQVNSSRILQLFKEYSPAGSTDLAWVLQDAIKDYYYCKAVGLHRSMRKLIVVVTDGEPDDAHAVKKAMQNAFLRSPEKPNISLLFIQVGSDAKAAHFLQELGEGYEFCSTVTAMDIAMIEKNSGSLNLTQVLMKTIIN